MIVSKQHLKELMIIMILIIIIIIIIIIWGVMSRPACGAPAFTDFTEHRHSKYPDLYTLINRYGFQ